MSIHEGHRSRLKDRFRKEGLENFEELYVLELLLFYCVPRQDTNELAHRLLNHFGSIVRVLSASPEELEQVEGVGEGISTFLSLRSAVERYYQNKRMQQPDTILAKPYDWSNYLANCFYERRNEVVYLLCLDGKYKALSCVFVGEGSVNSASVPIRKIVEIALKANATYAILAHNHPSGLAFPSPDDLQTTQRLAQAFEGVDIALLDHVIYGDDDCISLVDSGYYRPLVNG